MMEFPTPLHIEIQNDAQKSINLQNTKISHQNDTPLRLDSNIQTSRLTTLVKQYKLRESKTVEKIKKYLHDLGRARQDCKILFLLIFSL